MKKIITIAKNMTLFIRRVFKRIKDIWNLPDTVSKNHSDIYGYVNWLEKRINERTTVHTDIGWKGDQTQVIVVGRYRGKDYVRAFNVRPDSFHDLIDMLKEQERYAKVGRFDMVGNMEFSAVYPNKEF